MSSLRRQRLPVSSGESRSALAPVTLGEQSLLVLALVRMFVGSLWFQQLVWKMPPSYSGLHSYLVAEGQYTILPGYAFLIQHVFLPNFIVLGTFVWVSELVVALCLLFGVLTRFGGVLATLLAVQLYLGLAFAHGEWYWTYGMLVLLGIVMTVVPAGRRLGVDQWLAPRLRSASDTNRLAWLLTWFV